MSRLARGLIIDGPIFLGAVLMNNLGNPSLLSDPFAQGFTVALLMLFFFWLQGLRISKLDDIVLWDDE